MSQQTKKPSLRETFEVLGKSFRVSLGVKSKPSLLFCSIRRFSSSAF